MILDIVCVAILFHFHVVAKLIFKEAFKIKSWRSKVVLALIGLLVLIVYLELFVICGLPDDAWELVSLRCREPLSIVVEYSILFMLAAADFFREGDFLKTNKEKKERKSNKGFRKAFIALLTFSWLLYLNETDRDFFDIVNLFESIPKPWETRVPLHHGSKRVREKRKKAAARRN